VNKEQAAITWDIEIPYKEMAAPFAVGDRILRHGQRVEITEARRMTDNNTLIVRYVATPTDKGPRLQK
jgi:hypothetical protein